MRVIAILMMLCVLVGGCAQRQGRAELVRSMVCAMPAEAQALIGYDIAAIGQPDSKYVRAAEWARGQMSAKDASDDVMKAVWREVLDAQPRYVLVGTSDFEMPVHYGTGKFSGRSITSCKGSLKKLIERFEHGIPGFLPANDSSIDMWRGTSWLVSPLTPGDDQAKASVYVCFADEHTLIVGHDAGEAAAMRDAMRKTATAVNLSACSHAIRWGELLDDSVLEAPAMMLRAFDPLNKDIYQIAEPLQENVPAPHRMRLVIRSTAVEQMEMRCITVDKAASRRVVEYYSHQTTVDETSNGFESIEAHTEKGSEGTLQWLMLIHASGIVFVI